MVDRMNSPTPRCHQCQCRRTSSFNDLSPPGNTAYSREKFSKWIIQGDNHPMNVKLIRAKRARWTRFDFNWIDCEILFIQTLKIFENFDFWTTETWNVRFFIGHFIRSRVWSLWSILDHMFLFQSGISGSSRTYVEKIFPAFWKIFKILISTRLKFKKSSLESIPLKNIKMDLIWLRMDRIRHLDDARLVIPVRVPACSIFKNVTFPFSGRKTFIAGHGQIFTKHIFSGRKIRFILPSAVLFAMIR